jgi:predicted membrane protein
MSSGGPSSPSPSSFPSPSRFTGRTVAGVILVLLGVLFTLDNFGVVEAREIFRFWPLAIVALGVVTLSRARLPEQRIVGTLIIVAGAAFLMRSLGLVSFRLRVRELWPLFLVLGGGFMIWGSLRSRERTRERVLRASGAAGSSDGSGALLNAFAVMGGGERIVRDTDFRGGEVTAILGGFEIDLRQAGMMRDSAEIEIFTLWGGVDLKVPEDWNVVVQGVPILGGFSNTARSGSVTATGAPRKTLVVNGTVIMGGVEIKN